VPSKNTKGMVILLSLAAATLTNAAPTICEHNRSLNAPTFSINSNAHTYTKLETLFVTGLVDPHMAKVAAELNKPPADFSSPQAPAAGVKSLPHIPGTLLMVLTGFICVSVVRDRKTWLTILIGLMCIGQAGFNVLPQLASHLISKKQIEKKNFSKVTHLCLPEYPYRLRSDIEGTYYIGLLRYLAGIPKAESRKEQLPSRTTHQPAIIAGLQSLRSRLTNCLDTSTEQSIYIISKFVLISVIRGPPNRL
jgi:hypothetical protein